MIINDSTHIIPNLSPQIQWAPKLESLNFKLTEYLAFKTNLHQTSPSANDTQLNASRQLNHVNVADINISFSLISSCIQ